MISQWAFGSLSRTKDRERERTPVEAPPTLSRRNAPTVIIRPRMSPPKIVPLVFSQWQELFGFYDLGCVFRRPLNSFIGSILCFVGLRSYTTAKRAAREGRHEKKREQRKKEDWRGEERREEERRTVEVSRGERRTGEERRGKARREPGG